MSHVYRDTLWMFCFTVLLCIHVVRFVCVCYCGTSRYIVLTRGLYTNPSHLNSSLSALQTPALSHCEAKTQYLTPVPVTSAGGPDGSLCFGCGSYARGSGFESRSWQLFVVMVVHIQCFKLFKCLDCAKALCTINNWLSVGCSSDFGLSFVPEFHPSTDS